MDDSRIKKLSQQLEVPCLIEQEADLLYLTGLSLSKGRLLVGPEPMLFVDGRYYEKARKSAPCAVARWEEQKGIGEKRLGFDSAVVTYDGYLSLRKEIPDKEWIPMSNPVRELRAIKEPKEIALLKKAADLTWRGYQKVVEMLKVGVSEEELAVEFEFFCRRNGASGMSFKPIIAFGENSAYPHHRAGKSRLNKDQVVLVDVGAIVDDYCADMTRIFYFGKPDPRIVHFERIVKEAGKKAIALVRPGIRAKEVDQVVHNEFDRANVKQLYIHSLGHGIGLEAHEYPRIRVDGADRDVILKPGMVFTIEPGLYQPGVGGVRIEDMVLVTETGCENFFAHA